MSKLTRTINPFFSIKVEDVKTVESGTLVPRIAIINAETDKVVSVMSKKYQIIQNRTLVQDFEDQLKNDNVKFVRTGAGCNVTGSNFWANYHFPEIKTNVGEYETNFGKVNDDITLTLDLWNSYNGSQGVGFLVGGLRKVCMNGLWRKEVLYRFNEIHMGDKEFIETLYLQFDSAKQVFLTNMAKSWEELVNTDFNREAAANIAKAMLLGKYYQKIFDHLLKQAEVEKKLNTMWDFYNIVTWMTTHVMENRNRQLARQTAIQTADSLLK